MGIIHTLDPTTIQKIAAGEVIDRPASIVKELIENSIDAGSDSLTIDIDNGGMSRIQIVDNGSGLHVEDLPLAPRPHTTSKITHMEDIFDIHTRGFRGEALASIAHAGELSITSRHHTSDMGYQITASLDTISTPTAVAHPVGTTIRVTGLFESMPVRKRFLKSAATEFGYIYETVAHMSLIFPDVTFVLRHNGKESLNTRGTKTLSDRIGILVGPASRTGLIPITYDMLDIAVTGAVSHPGHTYANRKWQLFGINGRPVKSQLIYKAVLDAFADVIPARRFPLAVLTIMLPPDTIDVNIHPQKLDIKFQKSQHVYEAVRRAISGSFQRDEVQLADAAAGLAPYVPDTSPTLRDAPLTQPTSPFTVTQPISTVSDTMANTPWLATTPRREDPPVFPPSAYTAPTSQEVHSALNLFAQVPPMPAATASSPTVSQTHDAPATPAIPAQPTPAFLQILNTYIVIPSPTGMWVMDQHAVHERILYEQLKQTTDQHTTQPLLIPHPIHVPAKDSFPTETVIPMLREMGFEAEDFGHDQLLIRSVPQWATHMALTPFFEDLLDTLSESTVEQARLFHQKDQLQMKACKAAIKAGKTMHASEVRALITDFLASPSNYTCPHGRPLAKFFDRSAFERWFLR